MNKEEIGAKRIFQGRLFTEKQTVAKVSIIQVTTIGTLEFQSKVIDTTNYKPKPKLFLIDQ